MSVKNIDANTINPLHLKAWTVINFFFQMRNRRWKLFGNGDYELKEKLKSAYIFITHSMKLVVLTSAGAG